MKFSFAGLEASLGRKHAYVTEKPLLGLVLRLWGQDSPLAFAPTPHTSNPSPTPGSPSAKVPAPSGCQEWFLTFFGLGPTESQAPSQNGTGV